MERTIENITKEITDLYDKISDLEKERDELEIANYNFIGKYIKIKESSFDTDVYMYVYEMFLVENNRVLLRGVSFASYNCEYWDGSYFNWATDIDKEVDIDKLSEIEEISEEEYNEAFNKSLQEFLMHKNEFVDKAMKEWAKYNN